MLPVAVFLYGTIILIVFTPLLNVNLNDPVPLAEVVTSPFSIVAPVKGYDASSPLKFKNCKVLLLREA